MKRPFKTITASLLIAALCATPCVAALNAYLRITGASGEIEGGVTEPGREGTIEVCAFEHQVIHPRDAASGLPTGHRQHTPVKITKRIDKSSPLLAKALTNNETLTDVTIRFYEEDPAAGERNYYTVRLENAQITSLRTWKPNVKDPAAGAFPDMEEVQFTYQKIIWTYEDGGITHEDDWEEPAA